MRGDDLTEQERIWGLLYDRISQVLQQFGTEDPLGKADYPDWEIMFRIAVLEKEKEWPAMGLIIHDDGIIDDLQREYLPEGFRNIVYEGTK